MDDTRAPHHRKPRMGVLLVNLGSPQAPTPGAIRRYLREFLSDRRVVELPRILWLSILYLFVLPLRPRRIAAAYQAIWTDEGSPLAVHTRGLATQLQQRLTSELPGDVEVAWAMRYGQPSIASRLAHLRDAGVERLLVIPLYPQYSGSTTASVFDAVTRTLQSWRWIPELRFVNAYHDHPAYIAALADSLRDASAQAQDKAPHLVMSFHGVPERYIEQGDPYFCHAHKTARLLAESLELDRPHYSVSFQSQFGKAKWVGPSTSDTMTRLAKQGIHQVQVICPGFAADCIETLEEIQIENAEIFKAAGGHALDYVPALNASDRHVDLMSQLVQMHAAGWPELNGDSAQADRDAVPARVASLQRTH
ncbi:MAG: ferrochelatase [Pseudomonadota bacterium]|nr:ferrochelatase [Pseudomonadota bacterium]